MSFKLLAIRPMPGTDPKFLKNLKPGVIYKFYEEYEYLNSKGRDLSKWEYKSEGEDKREYLVNPLDIKERIELKEKEPLLDVTIKKSDNQTVPADLYSIPDGPTINISAVVGKNGSGKSGLVEMFARFIYCYTSYNNKALLLNSINDYEEAIVKINSILDSLVKEYRYLVTKFRGYNRYNRGRLKDLDSRYNMFYQLVTEIFSFYPDEEFPSIGGDLGFVYKQAVSHAQWIIEDVRKKLKLNKEIEDEMIQSFNCEIHFEVGVKSRVVSKIGEEFSGDLEFGKLFYTICLNYSNNSFNSKNLGDWIYSLFHKNDGYQTPLVLNPYRKEGNYNVNQEITLTNERIAYNLFQDLMNNEDPLLINKYRFFKIQLSLKEVEGFTINDQQINTYNQFFEVTGHATGNSSLENQILGYIFRKKKKTYDTYFRDYKIVDDKRIPDYIRMAADSSHKTVKLSQAIYFLKYLEKYLRFYDPKEKSFFLSVEELAEIVKHISDQEKISESNTYDKFRVCFPGFLFIDYELVDLDKNHIKLSNFSSGEIQKIYNLSTIVYHLNNLNSNSAYIVIKADNVRRSGRRLIGYENVNIFLDEIELYYHPEYQKSFVNDLIKSLENFKVNEVKNINIVFLTHSPFILSDIPSQNILRLEKGEPVSDESKTFGANIHNLLKNQFFLENGFQGEFATMEIRKIYLELQFLKISKEIRKVNEIEKLEHQKEIDTSRYKVLRENILGEYKKVFKIDLETLDLEDNQNQYEQLIDLIGEPILRNELKSLYHSVFGDDQSKVREVKRLMERLKIDKSQL